jgi:hypothetical protein
MEANHAGRIAFFEMAANGLADFFAQSWQFIGLGEDGLAQGARGVTALGCFFDKKYQFAHRLLSFIHQRAKRKSTVDLSEPAEAAAWKLNGAGGNRAP